jgi:hypothetical protein
LFLALLVPAFAGGFYHPNDVAGQSLRFAEAQSRLTAPLEERQGAARTLSAALRSNREGLDLLGDRAPAEQIRRLQDAETAYLRQFNQLQTFADSLIGDFDDTLTAALDRALQAHPGATKCVAEIAVGPRVPGMAGRTQANPECTGENLNAALAAAIDADPILAGALPAVVDRPWPNLGIDAASVDAVGTGSRYVHVQALIRAGANDALRRIEQADDDARVSIDAALEDGADAAELKALEGSGHDIASATRNQRAALAGPVLAAADVALSKWAKSDGPTAWCAQPQVLGGCVGTDATAALLDKLLADKKVQKALP